MKAVSIKMEDGTVYNLKEINFPTFIVYQYEPYKHFPSRMLSEFQAGERPPYMPARAEYVYPAIRVGEKLYAMYAEEGFIINKEKI